MIILAVGRSPQTSNPLDRRLVPRLLWYLVRPRLVASDSAQFWSSAFVMFIALRLRLL